MAINRQEIANSLAISAENTIRILLFISHIHMILLYNEDMNEAENFRLKRQQNRTKIELKYMHSFPCAGLYCC